MSTQRHVIGCLILELRTTGEQKARRLSDDLARICRRRIVPLIDGYCTKLGDPDRIHRIDSL
uniref:Uncharacterized protein n=1 Tax=Candidatus Kentrum sp. LFY TaxID=2126342 RepID=A0A450X2M8_9GAMM|nr:MAG: hypothetical protein BECKLFY1418C_GA0070996_11455 [Candidatus Kentron sp. LFY]